MQATSARAIRATAPVEERLAGAPISWGACEVPGWGVMPTPETVLTDMAQLGMLGTELGPPGFLPEDPVALAQRLEQTRSGGAEERASAGSNLGRERGIDVLEVYVHHTIAVLAGELHRIRPTDQQVPGVQAPPHLDHLQRAPHLLLGLDQRPGVRVQADRHPELRGQRLDRP